MLTIITVFCFFMVHCVPHDRSSNIQKSKEEVLGISQKSKVLQPMATSMVLIAIKSTCILHPIYFKFFFKEKVLIFCIGSSMR